jgi:uncharacterized protein (TIGR03086 family)
MMSRATRVTDVDRLFRRASAQFRAVIASLSEHASDEPTNCAVSVRELVEHVLAGNEFAVRLLSGADADGARSGIDGIQIGRDPIIQVDRSCLAQADAFAHANRAQPVHHPSGDINVDAFVRIRLVDVTVHAWDIAHATGLDPTLDPVLVAGLWKLVEPHLEQMQSMGVYGDAVAGTVGLETDPQVRLLHAFGRAAR